MSGMPELPRGTVTFLFSDIAGSTSLLRQLGQERYGEALTDYQRLVRDSCVAAGGMEVDTQGDAFFFAFPRARDAVVAAVEAQRAHAVHEWPDGCTVQVRMGLHTGEPAVGSEGYLGLDVVRAARLCTAGKGGHVLLSDTTRALVGASLPDGVSIFPLGERRLKDFDEPERVFELEIEGATPPHEHPTAEPHVQAPPQPPPPVQPGDFGDRLADRIKAMVEQSVERSLERAASQVDALAERAAKHPDAIAERLEED
jgi:class 3 adenylate cyclase